MKAFFFAPESPRITALIRIVLGATLLYDALAHWRYAVELYSTAGPPMPIFIRRLADDDEERLDSVEREKTSPPRVEQTLPVPVPTPTAAVLAHTLLVFSLLSMTLGWHTRASLAASIVLSLWLAPLDLAGTFAKHSVIALHLQVLLLFSCSGAVWSLDALFARARDHCRLASVCPRRLIQILICCIYVGAAMTKIKTPAFVNGDLVMFSLIDDHWGGSRLGIWLSTIPHLSLLLSLGIVSYELLFPFLIWVERCRLPLLGLAFVVHAAMGLLLNLGTFSFIFFAALLSFLQERDLQRLAAIASRRRHQSLVAQASRLPPAAETATPESRQFLGAAQHVVCAVAFAAAGFGLQWYSDWYSVFGRRLPPELAEIAASDVDEMRAERPLAYEDFIHHIAMGSRTSGNQMFGSARAFHIGERALVLVRLVRPHPRFEWEGLLIAPDGREAARFTRQVEPDAIYILNGFELTRDLPPGSYRLILQAEGFVVSERKFELRE
jgi:hypothetical protein